MASFTAGGTSAAAILTPTIMVGALGGAMVPVSTSISAVAGIADGMAAAAITVTTAAVIAEASRTPDTISWERAARRALHASGMQP